MNVVRRCRRRRRTSTIFRFCWPFVFGFFLVLFSSTQHIGLANDILCERLSIWSNRKWFSCAFWMMNFGPISTRKSLLQTKVDDKGRHCRRSTAVANCCAENSPNVLRMSSYISCDADSNRNLIELRAKRFQAQFWFIFFSLSVDFFAITLAWRNASLDFTAVAI